MNVFGFPEAGVAFAEQAVVELGVGHGQVEDVDHVHCVAAADVLDEFGGQVQDGGRCSRHRCRFLRNHI